MFHTPDSPDEQAHLEKLGLIEFKTKTKTLASNQVVILESFILRKALSWEERREEASSS